MFADFTATDRWTKKPVHCVYQATIVAIATRHADAVDIKFLVDGRKVWVALPHPAWVEYKKRTGQAITDSLAQEIAGHYLKTDRGRNAESPRCSGRGDASAAGVIFRCHPERSNRCAKRGGYGVEGSLLYRNPICHQRAFQRGYCFSLNLV